MDAAGSNRAAIVCTGAGTARAIHLTAAHPERVSALVVCDGYVRLVRADD
jgi:pimeloyl-ACP methyl ester carboxylesterase